ncbi:NUDIX hydrolase [Amycolatopsis sp.]|jgi:ADP-ribose pyrophosphatase YjhB (NUDIX family)|uniref:NUDIX hydrolase n=1 Tax=Amycolatopsis sp. TaxID=37632 RepID=UPI002DFC933C|nr:NUDIX domain-containing protein [Amycolatopsis sp.]
MSSPVPGTVRCVGGIVHDAAGRLLLIKRGNEPGRGLWSVPGGRVEPGETDKEAVVREIFEETGLDVIPGTLAGSVTIGPFAINDYVCTLAGGTLKAGDDATEVRWADAADFSQLDQISGLVDNLMTTLSNWKVLPRS